MSLMPLSWLSTTGSVNSQSRQTGYRTRLFQSTSSRKDEKSLRPRQVRRNTPPYLSLSPPTPPKSITSLGSNVSAHTHCACYGCWRPVFTTDALRDGPLPPSKRAESLDDSFLPQHPSLACLACLSITMATPSNISQSPHLKRPLRPSFSRYPGPLATTAA
jgi:hypothetical protein